jgi:hypothetical protein
MDARRSPVFPRALTCGVSVFVGGSRLVASLTTRDDLFRSVCGFHPIPIHLSLV